MTYGSTKSPGRKAVNQKVEICNSVLGSNTQVLSKSRHPAYKEDIERKNGKKHKKKQHMGEFRHSAGCLFRWQIKRIYDGVEAETRKSQASFKIIQVTNISYPSAKHIAGYVCQTKTQQE